MTDRKPALKRWWITGLRTRPIVPSSTVKGGVILASERLA